MDESRFGILVPSQTGNASCAHDQSFPFDAKTAFNIECFDMAVFLTAMMFAVNGLSAVCGA